jgi:predicted DNA-binding transcriptional regulator AlpA
VEVTRKLTEAEVRALDPIVDLPTAGRAFGMGRTKAYGLARAEQFPCPVLPLGARYVVTKTALMKALELDVPEASKGDAEKLKAEKPAAAA